MKRWCAAVTLAACAHAAPRPEALGPEWHAVVEQGRVGWYNPRVGGVIQGSESCTHHRGDLFALTRQLVVGYAEPRVRTQERVSLAGGEALHTVVDVKLEGTPMTLELYVLERGGCIVDLSFAAPPDRRATGIEDFRHFVAGWFRGRT